MIVREIESPTRSRSCYARLANYVANAQGKEHRLGQVRITNCVASDLRDAITEVLATQHTNTRAKGDKTYHLLVSFRANEQPDAETLHAIEERICAGLGYAEHQRISAAHKDTDNLHMHIVVNKIHPVRHTMQEPYYPRKTLAKLAARLELEYSLEIDNHEPRKLGAESRAADMERHSGIESLVGWIKRECLTEIKAASSWKELHQVLQGNGLELRVRANGFVFEAKDGTMVKASTVARELSKAKLEAKFGAFEAASEQQGQIVEKQRYKKAPIPSRVDTTELYAKYKTEQQSLTAACSHALKQIKQRKARLIEEAKRSGRLRRAAIKLIGSGRLEKKLLYAQASKTLKDRVQTIAEQSQQERQALYEKHSRRTWADWLKKEAMQGNAEALAALRANKAAKGLVGNTIQGKGQGRLSQAPIVDNITKKGTIIFRAGKSAIRDDGQKFQVSLGADQETLQKALKLAMERFGSRITVNGKSEFKEQIVHAAVDSQLPIRFADSLLEQKRQKLLNQKQVEQLRGRSKRRIKKNKTFQQ